METTFSKKLAAFFKKVLAFFLVMALITMFGAILWFFVIKKSPEIRITKELSGKITVDSIEDSRGLGYSGQRKIVADEKGNIFVTYRKDYNKHSEIFVARAYNDNGNARITGTDKPIVAVDKGTDQRVSSMAIDSKGTLHVVWYGSDTQDDKNNRQVKYARSTDQGASWSSWRNIAYVNGYDGKEDFWQEHPMIIIGKNDAIYAVWEGKDDKDTNQQIKFAKSTNGGNTWTSWKNIKETTNNTQSRPTALEDPDGKIYVFAYSSQGNNSLQKIQYSVSSDQGETWSNWKPLSDPEEDARHVSATIDSRGIIYLAWRSRGAGMLSRIAYRDFRNGAWSEIREVPESSSYQFFPNIGVREDGRVYITWMENPEESGLPNENPGAGDIFITYVENGIFSKPMKINQETSGLYPNIAGTVKNGKKIPVAYLEQAGNGSFSVILDILDI